MCSKNKEVGKKYKWADVEVEELYKFPGLLIYTRPVSPPSMADYWKQKNEEKKGTPGHEKLFRIRPLIDHILSACQAHYHPRKDLAVDERMVATKAKTGMTQFMNDKPTRWGFKLFVLADSSNDYTINFNKTHTLV